MKWFRNELKSNLNNETKQFLSNMENTVFWKGESVVAQRVVDLIWGNGYSITGEEEVVKYLTEFADLNNLEELGRTISHWLSLQGRVIVIISKTKGGEFYLELADPTMTNKIGFVNQREKIAVIYTTPFKDNKNWRMRTEITEEYIKRDIVDTANGDQEVTIETVNAKLDKEEQIEAYWEHKLGFLPVQEFLNKRTTPLSYLMKGQKVDYSEIADTYNGKDINNVINTLIREQFKEAIINHTRVHGSFGPKEIQNIQQKPEVAQDYMLNQLYLQAKSYGREGQGGVVNVDSPNLNLMIYSDAVTRSIGLYVNTAGLSNWFDGSDTTTGLGGETATGVLAQRELDYTTITDKRRQFISSFSKIIDKLLVAKGIEKDINLNTRQYSFNLSSDLPMSPLQKVEMIRLRQEIGLITKDEAIQELNPNMNEAELEMYKRQLEKDTEQEMEFMDKFNNEEENALKQPKNPSKKENKDNDNPSPDNLGDKESK